MLAVTCFGFSQTILRDHPELAGVMPVLFESVCCC